MKAIHNAIIYTGDRVVKDHTILTDKGKIIAIQPGLQAEAEHIDLAGRNIAPGFIDIQINGGRERYFSHQPDEATLTDIYESSCDFATPYVLPTLISAREATILQALEAVRQFRSRQPGVLGMHLEGPFLNPEKRGAHDRQIIRPPSDAELDRIIEAGKDVIAIMTIAPECFTTRQLEKLLESGIVLSAGHSTMTYEQACQYFSMGIRLVTHLYNAMTQLGHRECGLVGAIFDNDEVYAPIILDGGHCHYAAARIAYRQKKDKLILLSDSSFLGRRKQSFDWEGLNIQMTDGFYRDRAGNLAGAAISMPEAVTNAVIHLGVSLQEAVEMATSRVARAIGRERELGSISPGYPAVFSVFDDDLQHYEVLMA